MQEHIKQRETEPVWHALLMQVASCKNEDVMIDLDGTLKIKVECMERFAQAIARECADICDRPKNAMRSGPSDGDLIRARFGLKE